MQSEVHADPQRASTVAHSLCYSPLLLAQHSPNHHRMTPPAAGGGRLHGQATTFPRKLQRRAQQPAPLRVHGVSAPEVRRRGTLQASDGQGPELSGTFLRHQTADCSPCDATRATALRPPLLRRERRSMPRGAATSGSTVLPLAVAGLAAHGVQRCTCALWRRHTHGCWRRAAGIPLIALLVLAADTFRGARLARKIQLHPRPPHGWPFRSPAAPVPRPHAGAASPFLDPTSPAAAWAKAEQTRCPLRARAGGGVAWTPRRAHEVPANWQPAPRRTPRRCAAPSAALHHCCFQNAAICAICITRQLQIPRPSEVGAGAGSRPSLGLKTTVNSAA